MLQVQWAFWFQMTAKNFDFRHKIRTRLCLQHGGEGQSSRINTNTAVISDFLTRFFVPEFWSLESKVPTSLLMEEVSSFGSRILDKPKSPSFIMMFASRLVLSKMLAGLMSLWTMSLMCRKATPFATCLIILTFSFVSSFWYSRER